jgi:hypothetical protein
MTVYYLGVLVQNISICLDTDVHYHYYFSPDDIIKINMYSDRGPKAVIGNIEYDAQFTKDWNKTHSVRLSIANCITKGYLVDVTKSVHRNDLLTKLGI